MNLNRPNDIFRIALQVYRPNNNRGVGLPSNNTRVLANLPFVVFQYRIFLITKSRQFHDERLTFF